MPSFNNTLIFIYVTLSIFSIKFYKVTACLHLPNVTVIYSCKAYSAFAFYDSYARPDLCLHSDTHVQTDPQTVGQLGQVKSQSERCQNVGKI